MWQPANVVKGDKAPVLVFIYGGSDEFGEAEPYVKFLFFKTRLFMSCCCIILLSLSRVLVNVKQRYNMSGISAFHNTVTVNFNYRTGPIGWMSFPEDVAAGKSTGNWGILVSDSCPSQGLRKSDALTVYCPGRKRVSPCRSICLTPTPQEFGSRI